MRTWLFLILLMPATVRAEATLDDADLLGSWAMETEFQGRKIPATLTLARDGGAWVGEWQSQGRTMKLSSIRIEGTTLRFDREMGPGTVLRFSGQVENGKIVGRYEGPMGELACTGVRATGEDPESSTPPAPRVAGRWKLVASLPGQPFESTLKLIDRDGRLAGSWTSGGVTSAIAEAELDGAQLRFRCEDELSFEGTFEEGRLSGVLRGEFGTLNCKGRRMGSGYHDRPIVERGGRTLLWARESGSGDDPEFFDMTDAAVDPAEFQYGIGKDTIPSIDEPRFAPVGDPRLDEVGIGPDTEVLGFEVRGVSKAYPVEIMNGHEVVNDEFGGEPFAVLW